MDMEPREAESMAVTLTRMEGKLDSVNEKVTDLRAEVTQHRADIAALKSDTQQLKSDMRSAEETRIQAAAAVRQADEVRVAQAKAVVDNSNQQWTPWQRVLAILGALVGVVGVATTIAYYLLTIGH